MMKKKPLLSLSFFFSRVALILFRKKQFGGRHQSVYLWLYAKRARKFVGYNLFMLFLLRFRSFEFVKHHY